MPRFLLALCLLAGACGLQLTPPAAGASRCAVQMAAGLKSGDTVKVIAGADKGAVGKIIGLKKKKGMVVVEGVNVRSKHVKPMKEGEKGQILKKEMPVHISNVKFESAEEEEEEEESE